jgi:hypothetical protein
VEIFVVGIDRISDAQVAAIYPNPSTDIVHFRWSGSLDRIVIRDAAGKEVESISCLGKSSMQIHTSLAAGIYNAEFVSAEGSVRKSFVVNGK